MYVAVQPFHRTDALTPLLWQRRNTSARVSYQQNLKPKG